MSDAVKRVAAVFLLLMPALAQAQPGLFIGVYGGGEIHDVSHEIREGDVALRFDPADDGKVLALNVGYVFSNHYRHRQFQDHPRQLPISVSRCALSPATVSAWPLNSWFGPISWPAWVLPACCIRVKVA